MFLKKSEDEHIKISYNKLQCMIYQLNKDYYHYTNELFYDINTITSDIVPININILTEFSSSRDEDYISYTSYEENKKASMDLKKTILLGYIWDRYSPMSDKKIVDITFKDIIFENKSGINITEDSFKNEKIDEGAKNYMDFLTK